MHALNDSAQASFGVTKARIDAPALDGDGDGNPSGYSPSDLVAAVIDTGIDADSPRPRRRQGAGLAGLRQRLPRDARTTTTATAPTSPARSPATATARDQLYHGVAPAAGAGRAQGAQLRRQRLVRERHRGARLGGRQQGDLRDRGHRTSRSAQTAANDGTDLTSQAIDRAVARGDRRRGRGGQRGPGHVHGRHHPAPRPARSRSAQWPTSARRLLPGLLLEPRPDRGRPHQARRLGSRRQRQRRSHAGTTTGYTTEQRHEHGDAVRRRHRRC